MKPYYEAGNVTIYHGDCRDVMPTLAPGSIDCVITSPPYNLGGEPWPHLGNWKPGDSACGRSKWRNGSDAANGVQYGKHKDSLPHAEYVAWQQSILLALWGLLPDHGSIFYNHKPRPIGGRLWLPLELIPPAVTLRQIVIWARAGGMNFNPTAFVPTHEWIMVLARDGFRLKSKAVSGIGDVWRMNTDVNSHPAPFPLELPRRVIEATGAKSILDPYAGSGTTLRAAKDAGLKAIGIEIDERYCEIAAKRMAQGVFAFEDAE